MWQRLMRVPWRRTLVFLAGVLLFLGVALPLNHGIFNTTSDVSLYQTYATRALAPTAQFPTEYPPLATLVFVVPALLAGTHYVFGFALLAALAVWLLVCLVDRIAGRGWWFLLILVLGGWGTVLVRYDVFVVLLTLLGYLAAWRRRWLPAHALLALASALKLYPVLLVPLVLIWQWRVERKLPVRSAFGSGLCFILAGASLAMGGRTGFATMLSYHQARPLEFESFGATLAWLAGPVTWHKAFGSWNVLSLIAPWLLKSLPVVAGVLIIVLYISFALERIEPAAAWALVLLVAIMGSKVFSTQYLLWPLPFVVLAHQPSSASRPAIPVYRDVLLWGVLAGVTGLIFPVALQWAERDTTMRLVLLRNLLWLVAILTMGRAVARQDPWQHARTGAIVTGWRWLLQWRWTGLLLGLLLVGHLVSLRLLPARSVHPAVGMPDDAEVLKLAGFFPIETDANGRPFRWTAPHAALTLPLQALVHWPILQLTASAPPIAFEREQFVALHRDQVPWINLPVGIASRQYALLIPPPVIREGKVVVSLSSTPTRIPPDRRTLGVRMENIALSWPSRAAVSPRWQRVVQHWVVLLAGTVVVGALVRQRWLRCGLVSLLLVTLCWTGGWHVWVPTPWESLLGVASATLIGGSWQWLRQK